MTPPGAEGDKVSLGRFAVYLPPLSALEREQIKALQWIIERVDEVASSRPADDPRHLLVLGVPGHGKTTLTAILAQFYWVSILDRSTRLSPDQDLPVPGGDAGAVPSDFSWPRPQCSRCCGEKGDGVASPACVSGLTYDTGALVAAEGGDRRMWAMHRRALERLHTPTVPAGVLAHAWRGGPQPLLARLLDGCAIEPLDEPGARVAGQLLARAQSADVIDASVVAGALRRGDAIVTSDRRDVERLSNAVGRRINVIAV